MKDIKTLTLFMTLLNKLLEKQTKVYSIFIMILLPLFQTHAQDLRDLEHSIKFANYLFVTQQFALSSEEYERVVFLDTANNNAILKLLQSYRLSGKPDVAEQRYNSLFKHKPYNANIDISKEYLKNLILNKKFDKAYNYLENNHKFDRIYKESYQLGCILLQKKRDEAYKFAVENAVTNDKKNADLHLLTFKYQLINYKKPWLAAMYSAIIPGTGKMYAKNWKDGLISLLFVGVNSWQAYRGFHKYGTKSAYGWIFAGLATSFYISNIFGSHKAAVKYNKKIDDEVYHKAWHIVLAD